MRTFFAPPATFASRQRASARTSMPWYLAALAAAAPLALSAPARAQEMKQITDNDVVTGTTTIDFATRTNKDNSGKLVKDSPALGAQDNYKLDLTVAKSTAFSGEINRQPNLFSRTLHRVQQSAQLVYNITITVINEKDPSMKKDAGKWVGTIPIDTGSGAYDLGGGGKLKDPSPLRIVIDTLGRMQGFTDNFGGKLIGKAEKKESLASYTYNRVVGDKTQSITVKKVDPMKFENIELAKGPRPDDVHSVVNGRLDYDYETGNWLTDGITFAYTYDGKEYTDKLTGSIKWVEDKDRQMNGKGHYEFNLRFNEEKFQAKDPQGGDPAFAKGLSGDDLFFAVDNNIPALTGRIDFVDVLTQDGKTTVSSKVEYHLNANKLTKPQIMNVVKLWLVAVGPTNDD